MFRGNKKVKNKMKQGEELDNSGNRMTGTESVKNKYLLNEWLNLTLL